MKTEAEHLQHLLQKTKVKIQRDFEVWWSEQRSSKPNGMPVSRGLSRTSSRTGGASSQRKSVTPKEGSREIRRQGEGERMISPRTAWRTPPVKEGSMNGKTGKDVEASSKSNQSDSSQRHHYAIAARFEEQGADIRKKISPRRRLDRDFEVGAAGN